MGTRAVSHAEEMSVAALRCYFGQSAVLTVVCGLYNESMNLSQKCSCPSRPRL